MRSNGILCPLLLLLLSGACSPRTDENSKSGDSKPRSGHATNAQSPVARTSDSPKITPDEEVPEDKPQDLRAEFDVALALPKTSERDKALATLVWDSLELDPDIAREAFAKISPASPDRLRLLQHFAMRLAEEDPEDALEWAEGLDSETEIAAAKAQIALVLAEKEPERAAHLLSEAGLASRELDVAVVQVIQRWAAKSPESAAEWVQKFPEGEAREAGLAATLARWIQSDSKATMKWISGLQKPDARDESTRILGETMSQQAPEVVEKWLEPADAELRAALEKVIKDARAKAAATTLPAPK